MQFRVLYIVVFSLMFVFASKAQDSNTNIQSAEIEASKQTEHLNKQLNLTQEQSSKVYEINLKYAQKRQESLKRSDAVEIIKMKNEEIEKVLQANQVSALRNMRQNYQSANPQNETQTQMRTSGVTNRSSTQGTRQVNSNNSLNSSNTRQSAGNRPVRGDFYIQENARNSNSIRQEANTQSSRNATRKSKQSNVQQQRKTNSSPVRSSSQQAAKRNPVRNR